MSPRTTDWLPSELRKRLQHFDRYVRQLILLRGVGEFLITAAIALGLALSLDYLFDLGPIVRTSLLVVVVAVAVGSFWKSILRPLAKRRSAAELASLVDQSNPELDERLTSMVELNNPDLTDEEKGSVYMRELLTKETTRQAAQVDFDSAVSPARSWKFAAIGLVALAIILTPFGFSRSGYALLINRLIQPWGNYDSASNLYFEVVDGDRSVPRGTDVVIEAIPKFRTVEQALPELVRLQWRNAEGDDDTRVMDYDPETKRFVATLPHVFRDFEFRVSGGAARTRWYQVQVVEPPEIASLQLEIQPPAYTGRPAVRIDGATGVTTVFERSQLTFHMAFNKPIKAATVNWLSDPAQFAANDETQIEAGPANNNEDDEAVNGNEPVATSIADDGLSATLSFVAVTPGPFSIQLTDAVGLNNQEPLTRVLEIIRDQPPVLDLALDSEPQRVRSDDVVPVPVQATDDIAIADLELHAEVVGKKGTNFIIPADPMILGRPQAATVFSIRLEDLNLTNGQMISYRIRAADARPVPGPQEVWSEHRILLIKDDAELAESQLLEQQQQRVREEIKELLEKTEANRKEVEKVRKTAEENGKENKAIGQEERLRTLRDEQTEIAKRLENLAEQFATHPLQANLTEQTQKIARDEITAANEELKKAPAEEIGSQHEPVQQAEEKLVSAEKNLKELSEDFEELAKLEKDLLALKQISQDAENLARDAEAFEQFRNQQQQQQQNQQPEMQQQLADQQQDLQNRQQELTDELQELLEKRPEIIEAAEQFQLDRLAELAEDASELAEKQDKLAEAMEAEANRLNQELAAEEKNQELIEQAKDLAADAEVAARESAVTPIDPELLKEALEELKQGNLDKAEELASEVAEDVQRLNEELKKNEQLPDDPQKAAEELAKRQKELAEQIEAAAQEHADAAKAAAEAPDAEDANAQQQAEEKQAEAKRDLRKLAAKQAAIQSAVAGLDLPERNETQQKHTLNHAKEATERLLDEKPKDAANSAKHTATDLENLAKAIGDQEERRKRAISELNRLREQQRSVARDAKNAAEQNADHQRFDRTEKKQRELAKKLAELDVPENEATAEAQQDKAIQKAAAALTDIQKKSKEDIAGSQQELQNALNDLKNALEGKATTQEQLAEIRKKQDEIDAEAKKALQEQNSEAIKQAAEKQKELAKDLMEIEREKLAPEKVAKAAREAADESERKLFDAAKHPDLNELQDKAKDSLAKADNKLEDLERAMQPAAENAVEQAKQLAQAQQDNAKQANEQKQDADNAKPNPQAEEGLKDRLAQAEKLRAGNDAAKEKADAVRELENAIEKQQQANEKLAQAQEGNQNEQKAAVDQNAEAQKKAAEALQKLADKLAKSDEPNQLAEADQAAEQAVRDKAAESQADNDPATVAEKAAELADQQAELNQKANELQQEMAKGEKNGRELGNQRKKLAREQEQLTREANQLPRPAAGLPLADAKQAMKEATEALQKGELDAADELQKKAVEALEDAANRAERVAEAESNQEANPTEANNALEENAKNLMEQIAQAKEAQQPGSDNQPKEAAQATETAAQQQRELARQAAQAAMEAAQLQGAESPVTKQATEFAKAAAEASEKTNSGQLSEAGESAEQAANAAEQSAKSASKAQPEAGTPEQALAEKLDGLAERQAEVAQQMAELAEDATARAAAQQMAQQNLQQQTNELSKQLGEVADALQTNPLNKPQQSQQSDAAQQTSEQAAGEMQQAAQSSQQANLGDAKQQAEAAAQSLKNAAEQAQAASAEQPAEGSPVPGEMANQVAEAMQQLQQAGQQLAQSQPGQNGDASQQQASNQPQEGAPQQSQASQESQQGASQEAANGEQQPSPESFSQSLQQAAQSLAQATSQMQQNAQQANQQSQQAAASQPGESPESQDGRQDPFVDLRKLEADLKKMSQRDWGELPGQLRTEIMQSSRKKPNAEYSKLIKLYFEEIAKSGQRNSDPANADPNAN